MSNPDVTYFVDDIAVTAGEARVPAADFDNGMNHGASNAPGIGINQGGGAVEGTPEQFTLLDQGRPVESGEAQVPVAREAQISQVIGGDGITAAADWPGSGGTEGELAEGGVRFGTLTANVDGQPNPTLSGTVVPVGNSTLSDLAVGWTIQI